MRCFKCNARHFMRNCPKVKCFECGKLGHMSKACPLRRGGGVPEASIGGSGVTPKSAAVIGQTMSKDVLVRPKDQIIGATRSAGEVGKGVALQGRLACGVSSEVGCRFCGNEGHSLLKDCPEFRSSMKDFGDGEN